MIGIIITTFLRNELLQKCIDSIYRFWNDNYYVIIVDQNKSSCSDSIILPDFKGEIIKTEFDFGALQSRNLAIKRCFELKIPYILMMADSILFTQKYNFHPIIDFLNEEQNRFLCGFDIKDRISWECDMNKTDCFELDIPRKSVIKYQEINFQPVDICRNFFIAKTDLFINALYDEDRKLADHESSFWRFKEKNYQCFYCNKIQGQYIVNRSLEYTKYRNRFQIYKQLMLKKYGLKTWVRYSPELQTKLRLEASKIASGCVRLND